jgi:hypothetical protein
VKIGSFISHYKENEIFINLDDPKKNRDNFFSDLWILRNHLLELGVDISTDDINLPENSDFLVLETIDKKSIINNKIIYLRLMESDIIRSADFNPDRHSIFRKVFTWSDELVKANPKKYIKTNYSFDFPSHLEFSEIPRNKLCVMIAGNKNSYSPTELYSERLSSIKWFEKNKPNDFDLYGISWNRFYIRSHYKIFRIPNRFTILDKILFQMRPSYRGTVKTKKEVLSKYKFSICYENCMSLGYISEKIFDSFFSGCVPIYLGAPNIEKYIPNNAFIDKRDFKDYSELYKYLTGMGNAEYEGYQLAISDFLIGPYSQQFTAQYNAEIFARELIADGIIY